MSKVTNDHVEVWLNRDIRARGYGLTFTTVHRDGSVSIGRPVVFEKAEDDGGRFVDPTLTIEYEDAQQFLDQLWAQGVRPSNGNGNVGQLEATQSHLKDMRAIVADRLKVGLP